jgi:hypothetical protein
MFRSVRHCSAGVGAAAPSRRLKAITPLLLGERPLVEGLRELNRQMNDRVQYGDCAPYRGLRHPLPAGV